MKKAKRPLHRPRRDTKKALVWIDHLLKSHKIPYVVFGGFAANIYGSTRELADIDICIEERYLDRVSELVKAHAKTKLKRYDDHNWQVDLITLKYSGQEIDLCGIEKTRIFDKSQNRWIFFKTFVNNPRKKVYGRVNLHVVSKDKLLSYKSKLQRRVDKQDVASLSPVKRP